MERQRVWPSVSRRLHEAAVRLGLIAEAPRPPFPGPNDGYTRGMFPEKDPIKHAGREIRQAFGEINNNAAQVVEELGQLLERDFAQNGLNPNSKKFLQFAVMEQFTERQQKACQDLDFAPVFSQIGQERDVFLANLPFVVADIDSLQEDADVVATAAIKTFFDPIPKRKNYGLLYNPQMDPRREIGEVLAIIAKLTRTFSENPQVRSSN